MNRYEAQAAMELEARAAAHGEVAPLPDGYRIDEGNVLDFSPLLDQSITHMRLRILRTPPRVPRLTASVNV